MTTVKISNVSQRANRRDKKAAVKHTLQNPHTVSWPAVPLNVQNMVLASLLTLLENIGEYNLRKQMAQRKLKRAKHDKERKEKARAKKKQKQDNDASTSTNLAGTVPDPRDQEMVDDSENAEPKNNAVSSSEVSLPPEPPVLPHLTYGINEVTKRLEKQAESRRYKQTVSISQSSDHAQVSSPEPLKKHISHVFVCRGDIDPPLLVAHLPELVASCNVPIPMSTLTPVHLISLPKRAEAVLAEALAVKRVSILAFDSDTPQMDTIKNLLTAVQPPSAPWLTPRVSQVSGPPSTQLVPTHIKQLRTTAPRDIRKAKEERKKGRQAAKEKNKGTKNIKVRAKNAKVKRRLKIVAVSKDLLFTT